jgi:hypothetical protein
VHQRNPDLQICTTLKSPCVQKFSHAVLPFSRAGGSRSPSRLACKEDRRADRRCTRVSSEDLTTGIVAVRLTSLPRSYSVPACGPPCVSAEDTEDPSIAGPAMRIRNLSSSRKLEKSAEPQFNMHAGDLPEVYFRHPRPLGSQDTFSPPTLPNLNSCSPAQLMNPPMSEAGAAVEMMILKSCKLQPSGME